jgi:hypothetical protein
MNEIIFELSDRNYWIAVAVLSAIMLGVSTWADRRRTRRKSAENVGFMPWTAITVFTVMLTLIATAFAIKSI